MNPSDVYGSALSDYHQGNYTEDLQVLSSIMEDDVLPLPYLFRTWEDMPALEKIALDACRKKVLDIGAGSGCHSLVLEQRQLEVNALDQSPGACRVLKDRLKYTTQVYQESIWEHKGTYDSLLLLMNGTGIFGSLDRVTWGLSHLKQLLAPGGQILIDSSDLKFLFEDEDDGGLWVPSSQTYYGAVDFQWKYRGMTSPSFDWLYLHAELLESYAVAGGFDMEILMEGDHHEYLARLSPID
ncbi:methyltransferase domain-containing protein [Nonlabens xiamenensis]|uniref:methyltransferase domain-containing protein n=1 Tax=Nonlabens xiamenensis TaxID=2341043 RepID=UPI001F0CCED0|nr:methyltransferase domain-containing protein [Nonlabens xiamenensis]